MLRLAFVCLLASAIAGPLDAAIPAFARKYGLPCGSCHDPMPKLTPFGEMFLENGYSLAPGGDSVGTVSNGDDGMLVLNQVFPLAIRFDAYARYVGGRGGRSDLQTPYVVKLLSGGPIARNVSYYIYLLLAEEGSTGPLEDANVTFTNVLGAPLSLTVGQFQIIDPIWKRELRITREDYAILKHRPGNSVANLTYDRGITAAFAPSASTTVFGEVVNGNGIGPAEGGEFDGDGPKTALLAVTQKFGNVRLSLLGYTGRQHLVPTGQANTVTNRTRMIGPALQLRQGPFDVGVQYLYRDDSNPSFGGAPATTFARGGFAELTWWPRGRGGRLLLTGLYNVIESSDAGSDYETGTVNFSWLYARNLRLAGEATWDVVADRPAFSIGFATAF